jgi:prepilin peptidase CpaA
MITPTGALILLVPVLPIALWASLVDLQRFKIPNKAVMAMAAVWPLLGWLAVPTWTAWFWGLAILAIGIVLAYLAFALVNFPGGDGKYAAAIAPFFVGADLLRIGMIVFTCMLAATLAFQILRLIPPIRRLGSDWESFKHWRIVPFGLALSSMLVYYLVAAIWPQV